jgi:hypothetical protein
MRRRTWAGLALGGVIVVVLLVRFVLGIPLEALPAAVFGGSPDVDDSDRGFEHVGEGPHAFAVTVENLTKCGTTCRNFSGTVLYTGEGTAGDVSLDIRVTANGSELWNDTMSVGELPAGDTFRLVREADIGYSGSSTVLSNDGYVTVWIEVVHADGRETLRKRLKAV